MVFGVPGFLASAAAAGVLAAPVVRVARARGFTDPRPGGAAPPRKRGNPPAVPVGGLVLAAVVIATGALMALGLGPAGFAFWAWDGPNAGGLLALFLAFALGLLDDALPRGLGPAPKLLGQLAVAGAAAWMLAPGAPWWVWAATVLFGIAALNLVNTFDHADGLALGLGVIGFAAVLPWLSGACAGLLPWNLRAGSERAPKLYLGDAGSHLLGACVLLCPAAWPVLAVPALDLARVCLARLAAREAPWRGDTRHLGQVLERAGAVRGGALLAGLAVLPSALAPWYGWPWCLVSAALYAALIAWALWRQSVKAPTSSASRDFCVR